MTTQNNYKYEVLTFWEDPYDIACGDVPVHVHQTWNDTTEAELKRDYAMCPAIQQEDGSLVDATFEEWVEDLIAADCLRRVGA